MFNSHLLRQLYWPIGSLTHLSTHRNLLDRYPDRARKWISWRRRYCSCEETISRKWVRSRSKKLLVDSWSLSQDNIEILRLGIITAGVVGIHGFMF